MVKSWAGARAELGKWFSFSLSLTKFVSPCPVLSLSNLNGISDEYQNQIQVSQDKHGLDCILNEKRRILPRKGKRIFWIFKLLIKKTFDKVIGSDSRLIIGFENENKCFPVSITIINACWKEPGYYKCFLIKSRMLMTFWRLL